MIRTVPPRIARLCLLSLFLSTAPAAAQQASVVGIVQDPLGARVAGATVTLVGEQGQAGEVSSGQDGAFTFADVAAGRYHVTVLAPGFEAFTSDQVFAGGGDRATVNVTVQLGPLRQEVVVTAAAATVSQAQTGAPVTVIDEATLEALNKPDLLEAPLVGERPFRRPANSGTLLVSVTRGPGQVTLAGYFAGKRDDSTFLSDELFGNSMLLPNQDLAAGYQKIDLSGAYDLHRRLRAYVSIENLLDQDYEASFGFPALPLTARLGFRVTLGGE